MAVGDFVRLQYGSRRFHVTIPKVVIEMFGWSAGDLLRFRADCIPEFNGDCVVLYKGERFVGRVLS